MTIILIPMSRKTETHAENSDNGGQLYTEQTITITRKATLATTPPFTGPASTAHLDQPYLPVELVIVDTHHYQSDTAEEGSYIKADRAVRLSGPPLRKDGVPMMNRGPIRQEWRTYEYDNGQGRPFDDTLPAWIPDLAFTDEFAGPIPTVADSPWVQA